MPPTQRQLQVTPNRRFLQHADGTPFFYLGDTAWELFHRVTLTEANRDLTNRAAKAFTVDRRLLHAARLKESWFDPRCGSEHRIATMDNGAYQTYAPPTNGRGNDWLLLLEGRTIHSK